MTGIYILIFAIYIIQYTLWLQGRHNHRHQIAIEGALNIIGPLVMAMATGASPELVREHLAKAGEAVETRIEFEKIAMSETPWWRRIPPKP